ncbi:MAG: serine acetyltransferase [Clostridiales bacterium]|nr:serine acetyltransferase [Candidatus Blautia equi]
MSLKKEAIIAAEANLTSNYREKDIFHTKNGQNLPSRAVIIDILKDLRKVLFPGYFSTDTSVQDFPEHYVGHCLNDIYDRLKGQIEIALLARPQETDRPLDVQADEICGRFIKKLPDVQLMLLKDVQAGFNGDPAAKSLEEIICSYPGVFAIYVYRLAHILYREDVPYIPRIMTEYAHSGTGIDINPGATIGENFFIDHGTGVVIGETTTIGNNVKLYQGVTLGALSTRKGQQLANVKRHPTICDNVTIYANSTVLGGETVIGENVIIGGNTFITESIPANTKVSTKSPELVLQESRDPKKSSQWEI